MGLVLRENASLLDLWQTYPTASRQEKSYILTRVQSELGYSRKYAIRRLNAATSCEVLELLERQRGNHYRNEEVVEVLWEFKNLSGCLCSKLIRPALSDLIPYYERTIAELSFQTKEKLAQISAATIDRVLAEHPQMGPLVPYSLNDIPGFDEVPSLSLRVELWSESQSVDELVRKIQRRLRKARIDSECILCLSDQNTGWLEKRFLRCCNKVEISKLVRSLYVDMFTFGLRWEAEHRDILKTPRSKEEYLALLNHYFRLSASLLSNHFLPCFKVVGRIKTSHGYKGKHDLPMAPVRRFLDSAEVPDEHKKGLERIRAKLDPFLLQQAASEALMLLAEGS